MPSAKYGVYGSLGYYAALAMIASLSLVLVAFTDLPRTFFIVTLSISVALFVLSFVVLFLLSRRIGVVPEILAAAKIRASDRVLDVGTGRGFLAIEIAKAVPGCRVVGIDVWSNRVKGEMHTGFLIGDSRENAESNALLEGVSDRVEFRRCDAREMPFQSESFDVVVSYAALHQMAQFGARNGDRAFREIRRVLRPGGRFVAVEPLSAKGLARMLKESKFSEVQLQKVRKAGPLSFFFKMLSATKGELEPSPEHLPQDSRKVSAIHVRVRRVQKND